MHPSFDQFVAALRDPALRAQIGLSISDADADALVTRQDWANDYYYKWLAMFPAAVAAAAAAPAAERAPEPVAMSAFAQTTAASPAAPPATGFAASPPAGVYGAPPQSATRTAAPSTWQMGPAAPRIPSRAKVPLIVGGALVALVVLAVVGVNVYSGVVASSVGRAPLSAASHAPTDATDTSDDVPADTHGLTAREYRYVEVIIESENSTIPILVSKGMTDAKLRTLTDQLIVQSDPACSQSAQLSGGFDNAAFRASFIAGYVATTKVSSEAAGKVFDALAVYCHSA